MTPVNVFFNIPMLNNSVKLSKMFETDFFYERPDVAIQLPTHSAFE
jgi:hypothetical protein